MAMDMVGGIPLQSLRRQAGGGIQTFGGGGGGGGASSGPARGLQSLARPQVQTMGGVPPANGGGVAAGRAPGAQQAVFAAQQNQNIQNRYQPFLNSQGGMTYATGPAPNPVGYDQSGRGYYGWGPDGPIYNPTTNYVQFGPGEGPDIPRPRNTGPAGPPPANGPEMGGQIAPLPVLPPVNDIGPIDDTEAVRAAYGRAKDVAGQQGRAAMNALMEVQGGRGIVGSGLGVNEAGGVIMAGANQLADVNREQAIQRVENERWRQGTNYQGRINQRGQDYGGRGQELERRRYNAGNLPRGQVAY